jgi:hypothetical protein
MQKSKKNGNGARRGRNGGKRKGNGNGRRSNNPLTTNGSRGAVGQKLTSTQFTATSPLNLFETRKGSSPGGIIVKGREMIGSIALATAATGEFQSNSIVTTLGATSAMALSPRWFPRLSAYITIYEYYKFHSATLICQSLSPTTSAGAWFIAVDEEYTDTTPTTSVGVMRNVSSSMANVYSDMSCVVDGSLSRLPRYSTNAADTLQDAQAKIISAVEGFTGLDAQGIGYLIIDYEIEFFVPQ